LKVATILKKDRLARPMQVGSGAASNAIRKNASLYHIPDEVKALADEGIQRLITSLALTMAPEKRTKLGSRPLKVNSVLKYESFFKGLRHMFSFIGDYQSLLIMLDRPPEPFVPSMGVESIRLFIDSKTGVKGTSLVDRHGVLVKDVLGRNMVVQGGWNDPTIVAQLLSAISGIHSARQQRGQYLEACQDCIDQDNSGQLAGCRYHRGTPLLWRKGNPKESDLMMNVVKQTKIDNPDYVPKGDTPLSPWELISMRTYLISQNTVWDLMIWTMTLVACMLFLREDEVASLSFESINYDLCIVNDNGTVEGVSLKVQGKSDPLPVTLMLWANDEVPELCPIRHLLCFIYLTGVTEGPWFPSKENLTAHLKSSSRSSGFSDVIEYATYQERFKTICHKLFKRDGPFGSHSNRKTAYLVAIWGGGEESDVMLSARHKSASSAIKYRQDAKFLLNVAQRNQRNVDQVVSKWRPIYCRDVQMGRSINASSSCRIMRLDRLAIHFMEKVCGVTVATSEVTSVSDIVRTTIDFKTTRSTREQLFDVIDKLTDSDSKAKIGVLLQRYLTEIEKADPTQTEINVLSKKRSITSNDDDGDSINVARDGKRRCGDNDLPIRLQFKNMSSVQKLEQISAIRLDVTDQRELTSNARTFFLNVVVPIGNCLQNHFNDNHIDFLLRYPSFAHTTFRSKICNGKGTSCQNS
jgi:hypothetical protein